jgi:threonine 3-dehydrogenase
VANERATALVWLGGPDFELRSLPIPEPGVGDVVVEVDLATVCGSDLHTVSGRRSGPHPGVLGHEAVGRVRRLGPGGRHDHRGDPLQLGDRVVWGVTDSCGRCDRCRAGRSAKCRELRKVGHEPLNGPWPLSGGYATHVVVPAGVAVVRVPAHVPDAAAAVAACALATVMACVEACGEVEGRSFLVSGLGMLGLSACAVLADRGAARIVGIDPDPSRRATSLRMGAHEAVGPGELDGRPADGALELSGAPSAVAAMVASVDVGGRVVLAGSVAPAGLVEVDPERIVRGHLSIVGVHNYEPTHLVQAVDVLATAGRGAQFARLVAAPVPLSGLPSLLVAPGGASLRGSVDPRLPDRTRLPD